MTSQPPAPLLYALLVGIDDYPRQVPRLRGCVADVAAVEALLRDQIPADSLRIVTLTDQQATTADVTAAFSSHLGRAGAGDTALFWYSGHGSQRRSIAPAGVEPDGLDETLVFVDSRTAGGADFSDQELGALIGEIAPGKAHVVIGLDCCHSGSGTREADAEVQVRRAPTDPRPAPRTSPMPTTAEASGWQLGNQGRHVLLAACRADQTAKELLIDGTPRGVLTAAVERALRSATSPMTYRDLHRAVGATARGLVRDQAPQLEVTDDADAGRDVFSGILRPRPPHYLLTHDRGDPAATWVLDAGAVHGIPIPAGAGIGRTVLAVFPRDTDGAGLGDRTRQIATATVRSIESGTSRVTVSGDLDAEQTYRAVLVSNSLAVLAVTLTGEPDRCAAVREALQHVSAAGPSLLVRETAQPAQLAVDAGPAGFRISDLSRGSDPVAEVERPADVATALDRIAAWHRVAGLRNPGGRLDPAQLTIELTLVDPPLDAFSAALLQRHGDEVHLRYADPENASTAPRFTVRARNNTNLPLYCAVLGLSQNYAINAGKLGGALQSVPAGESILLRGGKPLTARVPDDAWRAGVTRREDVLLLIASTTEFDPVMLAQPALGQTWPAGRDQPAVDLPRNTLQSLLGAEPVRELDDDDDTPLSDWTAVALHIVVERAQSASALGAHGATLTGGVRVEAHPGLTASVSLASSAQATRDSLQSLVPPLLLDQPEAAEAFSFVAGRGGDLPLDVMEFRDAQDWQSVSPQHPLTITVDGAIGADEHVLAIGFDGENYLPVGVVGNRSAAGFQLRIAQLPPPISTRSLVGSITLLFRKLLAKPLGLDPNTTRLAVATIDPRSGEVSYDDDPERLRAAVRGASRIGLFLHGIIGDTRGMVASSQVPPAPGHRPYGDRFDLRLAFDYENIGTPIEVTADALRQQLTTAGIGPADDKRLELIAHSMGGLVSRCLIENLGGRQFVDRLITLGTPNGGSPWPRVEDWAIAGLTFGLNRLADVFWPAKILAGLTALIERVDVGLDQMAPYSTWLRGLHGSPDPGIRYVVLVGDRSLIVDGDVSGRIASIVVSLGRRLKDGALWLAFIGKPNDMAVSVESAIWIQPGRAPNPQVVMVGCDHVTYFSSSAGLTALTSAVNQADPVG